MNNLVDLTPSILTHIPRHFKWPSLVLTVLILLAICWGLPSQAKGAQKHGCAPDAPPAVSQAVPAEAQRGEVLINEVLSQPKSSWNCADPSNSFSLANDSWIELYNPQSHPLDLYTAHTEISVNGGSTNILLPFGSQIPAQGFLVIFPLEHQAVAAPTTWNIILSIDNFVIDQAAIPLLQPDQSYARVPDGATTWLYAGDPTIDASNNATGQPVLPTPTKTPRVTPTVTSVATVTSQAVAPAQPINSGTQPAWSQVKFPPDPTPSDDNTMGTTDASTSQPSQAQDPPVSTNNGPGWGMIVLLAFFGLLLLGVLFWCWRLFRTP